MSAEAQRIARVAVDSVAAAVDHLEQLKGELEVLADYPVDQAVNHGRLVMEAKDLATSLANKLTQLQGQATQKLATQEAALVAELALAADRSAQTKHRREVPHAP